MFIELKQEITPELITELLDNSLHEISKQEPYNFIKRELKSLAPLLLAWRKMTEGDQINVARTATYKLERTIKNTIKNAILEELATLILNDAI